MKIQRRSKYGLIIRPSVSRQLAAVDHMLAAPSPDAPALTLDSELAKISSRFGRPTADIVALAIEYPWSPQAANSTRRSTAHGAQPEWGGHPQLMLRDLVEQGDRAPKPGPHHSR